MARPGAQLVLFDTPGIHKPMHEMNRRMVETAAHLVDPVYPRVPVRQLTPRDGV